MPVLCTQIRLVIADKQPYKIFSLKKMNFEKSFKVLITPTFLNLKNTHYIPRYKMTKIDISGSGFFAIFFFIPYLVFLQIVIERVLRLLLLVIFLAVKILYVFFDISLFF